MDNFNDSVSSLDYFENFYSSDEESFLENEPKRIKFDSTLDEVNYMLHIGRLMEKLKREFKEGRNRESDLNGDISVEMEVFERAALESHPMEYNESLNIEGTVTEAEGTEETTSEPEETEETTSEPEETEETTSEAEKTASEPEGTEETTSEPEGTEETTSEAEKTTSEPEGTEETTSEPEGTEETTSEPDNLDDTIFIAENLIHDIHEQSNLHDNSFTSYLSDVGSDLDLTYESESTETESTFKDDDEEEMQTEDMEENLNEAMIEEEDEAVQKENYETVQEDNRRQTSTMYSSNNKASNYYNKNIKYYPSDIESDVDLTYESESDDESFTTVKIQERNSRKIEQTKAEVDEMEEDIIDVEDLTEDSVIVLDD